jgi:lipopolysaccharide transport system ATP-binding protein
LRTDEFWAVDDASFELRRGECLGLIGRNGAGKTTLLRMLNGLIKPDKGCIEMRGRVGALIALGAGFNPILTGRENIYVNASVLGLGKKEIDNKLEEIIDFAEIGEFIDSPVQTYSSGMQVRLGFAVATTLEPDIILLDEVLAVGDAPFRNKCYQRIGERRKNSGTILVSHTMDQVGQFCDRVLVLSSGHVEFDGSTTDGISIYENLSHSNSELNINTFEQIRPPITDVEITFDRTNVPYGEHIQLKLDLYTKQPISKTTLKIVFYDQQHCPCAEWNSERIGHKISLKSGTNSFQIKLGPMLLKTGRYRLGIVLTDEYGLAMLLWSFKKHEIMVEGFTTLGPTIALRSELTQPPNGVSLKTNHNS